MDDDGVSIQYECANCQHRQAEDAACEECESEFPQPVKVTPCPNGVTAEDWRANREAATARCDDDFHEWKSGEHVEYEDS